jgi:hypothetical protein
MTLAMFQNDSVTVAIAVTSLYAPAINIEEGILAFFFFSTTAKTVLFPGDQ